MATKNTSINDGGYYAIKGFTFQFDKSLSEAINDKEAVIQIEQIQDISKNDYYIQVKHKEALTYSPSKVKPAIRQLIDDFQDNREREYALYCYFKDKEPSTLTLAADDLDKILGKDKDAYSKTLKNAFIKRFTLEFSVDFDSQFKQLVKDIRQAFGLKSDEEAVLHHASFRAELLSIAIRKQRSKREISFSLLEELIKHNEKVVFDVAYSKYLTNTKYLAYIKKEFFTHKRVNVSAHERLIVISLNGNEENSVLTQALQNIQNRFYIHEQSPAPFVLLVGMESDKVNILKQELWTMGVKFTDGTNFQGDVFRLEDMQKKVHTFSKNDIKLKWIDVHNIELVLKTLKFDATFTFICDGSAYELPAELSGQKFYVKSARDIIEVTK